MSAAPTLDRQELDALGVRPRGGHLSLVPALPDDQPAAALRLTRRGRLAVTITVSTLVLVMVASLTGMLPAFGAGADTTVTVEPGQTLSQIAATELPELPLSTAVTQIQLANRLNTDQVAAGQVLTIPDR